MCVCECVCVCVCMCVCVYVCVCIGLSYKFVGLHAILILQVKFGMHRRYQEWFQKKVRIGQALRNPLPTIHKQGSR